MKKKIIKLLIISVCLFCVICQLTSKNVYADTIEEVKGNTEFEVVEEGKEPDDYDFMIDAANLISSWKMPNIRISIEEVLYNTSQLLSIDFFGNESTSDSTSDTEEIDEFEQKLLELKKGFRELIRSVYRISLYIALACMLVLLIYMAVIVVSTSISPNLNILPFSKLVSDKKGGTPEQERRAKTLVEQWFKTVLTLALAVFVMNLMVSFADNIVATVSDKKVEEQAVKIYVKNAQFAENAPILDGTSASSSSSENTVSALSISSDDAAMARQKVIDVANTGDNMGAEAGYCLAWVVRVYQRALGRELNGACCAHQMALISNTSTDMSKIVPGAAVFSYKSYYGTKRCGSCGKDPGHIGIYVGNGKIANFIGKVNYDSVDKWNSDGQADGYMLSCWGWIPGTEYLANGATAEDTGASGSSTTNGTSSIPTKTVNFCFTTSLEGYFMLSSQYKSEDSITKAIGNAICGGFLTVFKVALYVLFFGRMAIIAFISALAPILIVIDSLKRIGRAEKDI